MKRKNIIILVAVLLLLVIVTPIMFFYLSTMMATPKTVVINAKESQAEMISPDSTVTVLLTGTDEYVYYKQKANAKKGSLKDLRSFLVEEKIAESSLAVIIVPLKAASYQNTVDLLDEMAINKIRRYAIVEERKEDLELANKLK